MTGLPRELVVSAHHLEANVKAVLRPWGGNASMGLPLRAANVNPALQPQANARQALQPEVDAIAVPLQPEVDAESNSRLFPNESVVFCDNFYRVYSFDASGWTIGTKRRDFVMRGIASLIVFHSAGFFGQWLGYGKGVLYLLIFWALIMGLIWLGDKSRWSQLVQTGVQSAGLVILLLFALKCLKWGL